MISINRPGLDPAWFLGPEGPVAEYLRGYEQRPEQIEMAVAITTSTVMPRNILRLQF